MDRRALKFMQKRADTESDTTTPVSATASQGIPASAILAGGTLPLKDNSNIREKPLHHNYNHNNNNSSQHTHTHQQQQQQQVGGKQLERPLKCLETLAQKAGITFDEKYDVASPPHPGIAQQQATSGTGPGTGSGSVTPTSHRHGTPPTGRRQTHTPNTPNRPSAPSTPNTNCTSIARHTSLTLEKAQNPGQQVAATTTVPLQISPEQLQQFYASNPYAIQVKQEFPTHTTGNTGTELKHATNIMEVQQQLQLQQQLSEASGGGAASAGAGGAASPANSQQSQQQQHSTAISTMSPMQLAAATGGVGGDWTQGRTVQLMQPSTSFLYPQMIVSGNLLHPGGLGQQPIQVITAGKPFQGNGPQMLTTTTQNAKQMIGGQAGFAGGNFATCIPTNHNQSPQTVLFSPMNVISPQQQQNLLQSMAAAAQQQQLTQQQQQFNQQQQQQLTQQQQQLTAALAKVGVDAQGKLAQKVVQKVTTTSSAVQAATGPGSTGSTQTQQVQQQQQQTTQTTQQCVQVSQSTLPVGVGAQSVQTAQLLNAGQAQQMQIPWFLQNAAGLQPFGSNQIILRNQPDGTQGMFIQQQPATQTLQTQQNQIIQCNVTQTPTKARTQLDALAPKQQQQQVGTTNQTQQQQLAVATAQLQQQQQQLTAAALQRPGAPIMPHNGTQVRPASSVSTQTAQNQSLLKAKMRNKQQPVRPALSTLKTEIGQVAGQNKVVGHLATVQQQQQATNLQQVVNAAGNKMVVMSTTGTPITLQNGQTLHAATTAGVDKQQQLQLIEKQQLQLIQKQQILQQQMLQQQIAAIQMQHQQAQQQQQQQVTQQQQVNAQQQQAVAQQQQAVAQAQQQQREQQQQSVQAQAQHQQALANATQQILQVAPNQFITSHQQQQQQQLHNQLIQQQLQQQAQAQVQAQVQAQAQQQQQQREQQQNIIQQIVVQQSAGATAQQQQPHHQSGQLQLSSVPFSVSSTTTPAGIATSSALQAALSASGAIFQTAKTGACSSSSPTSSVVTITNQNSTPLVTSSTVASLQQAQAQSQAAQVQQHQQLISATIAGGTQQQQQGPPSLTPTTNPILAMTSMMNATVGHLSTAPPVTVSVTSTAVTPSPGQLVLLSTASSGGGGSISATPTKDTPLKGPTATLVPINSPKTPVSGKDTCTTPKSSTPATVSASVEASSSTSEALSNGEASDRSSTPSKGATTPTSKQNNAVQPPSSTTPSASGKEEPKLATSGTLTSATSTSTTTTVTNGIGVAKTTATTTTGSTTTTTSSGTFTTSCTSTTTTTTSSISNGSKDLPKAMIKPNVLTHVIDGFIIQEANEPFPVTRQRYADKDVSDEPPKKKATMQEDIKLSGMASAPGSDMVACEQCGKMEHKAKLKRKRYCSPGCSRQAKNGIGGGGTAETNGLGTGGIVGVDAMALVDKLDEAMAEEKMQTETTPKLLESFSVLGATTEVHPKSLPVQAVISASSPLSLPLGSPLAVALPTLAPLSVVTSGAAPKSSEVNGTERPPISSWSVDDVSNFIRELPGCQDYVDDFIQQEIDGQALLLLKENHLVNAMGMKLGPALKIVAKVESIKEVPPPGEAKDPGAQ
ncbi:polyhomeotic-proximal chromatin protein [Drosophila santomea]|uniref:polyhomeotic-proximal chromatin protein n=1 Tax=Drosophila santomea TaxID=129105 RepID=UPI001952BF40|nr:polyhomeotic-proximal chromatin protein [Drosophila santomea]